MVRAGHAMERVSPEFLPPNDVIIIIIIIIIIIYLLHQKVANIKHIKHTRQSTIQH